MSELLPSPGSSTDLNAKRMSGLFSAQNENEDIAKDLNITPSDRAAKKKVGFQPLTTHILDVLTPEESDVTPSLRSLPRSRDCYLSARPILKTTLSTDCITNGQETPVQQSWATKMESLMTALDNNDISSSVDAYATMIALIKMYDEPPDHEVLKTKMPNLQRYIKRDLVVLDEEDSTLDLDTKSSLQSLVINTQKVMVTMAWHPSYAPCMTDEFRVWTVERAIAILEGHSASKTTILHYMHLLAMQNYRASILQSNDRALRILEALDKLDEHVTGKAITSERCLIYQKLIDQAKMVMKAKADLWVKHLIVAMGHHVKDIRKSAISAGTKACTIFAGSQSIVHATRSALSETNGERTLSASVTTRLEKILQTKENSIQIPHIWTVVLMMANNQQNQIDRWSALPDWLRLLQRCFNCSDHTVRVEAFTAWNHLYSLVQPSLASEKVLAMLSKPAATQLDKTGDSSGKRTRQAAASSYTMLLYYAFRPSTNHRQYTHVWNEYVVKTMTRKFLSRSRANRELCRRILAALFYNTSMGPRIWKENRFKDNSLMSPEELPVLDSKWIRSRISAVLEIVRLLIECGFLIDEEDSPSEVCASVMWRNLLFALKEAGSKEIIASLESRTAQRSIVELLESLKHIPANGVSSRVEEKIEALVCSVRAVFPALLPCDAARSVAPEDAIAAQQQQQECNAEAVQALAENGKLVYGETSSTAVTPQDTVVKELIFTASRPKFKRRMRHDDSQIEFVSVQSSPHKLPDTQLMTTHQQETRDRQRSAPALTFADIKSSPLISNFSVQLSQPLEVSTKERATTYRPTTPPLVHDNNDPANEEPATPTPRTRKTMASISRPDVISSPASVIDQESGNRMSEVITSSPIKDKRENGGRADLRGAKELEDVVLAELIIESKHDITSLNARRASPELGMPQQRLSHDTSVIDVDALHEPALYISAVDDSDEFDALAASQLTQNSIGDGPRHIDAGTAENTPQSASTVRKRKRHDGYAGSDGKHKRRRASKRGSWRMSQTDSQISESFAAEQQDAIDPQADSSCIIVDPDICRMSDVSPARESCAQDTDPVGNAVAAITSQEPANTIEPTDIAPSLSSPQTLSSKQKKRRRGRPRKNAIEASAIVELQPTDPAIQSLPQAQDVEDTDMIDQSITEQDASEVPPTSSFLPQEYKTPSDQILQQDSYLKWKETLSGGSMDTTQSSNSVMSSNSARGKSETTVSLSEASVANSGTFNLQSYLQLALDNMDQPQRIRTNNFDFVTIYNLCARIGLKAQELAASWAR